MTKNLKPVDQNVHEDKDFTTAATVYKTGKTEGIAIKTAKKNKGGILHWRKSFWIQKDQDVNGILNWLFYTVKNFFAKFWGKEIITSADVSKSEKLVGELREKLRQTEAENEELKMKYALQQKDLDLAREVISKPDEYTKILNEFERMVTDSVSKNERVEGPIKDYIKKHRWILGLDCEVKAKNKDIDTQTEIDLHIITNYSEDRVIEVKSPNLPVFPKETGTLTLHAEIAKGLGELVVYLRRTNTYSILKSKGVYGIDKPIGRLLVGYELTPEQREVLNDWNFHLGPCIKIITFKDLIANAKKEIELINYARKTSDVKAN